MHRSLLACGVLGAMLLGSQPVYAQYILAGRAAGATYVDLVPDKVLVARKTGVSNALDSLDLDADGRFDLRLAAYTNTSNFPSEAETRVLPLHDNVAIYSASQAPYIVAFASNDSIQQRMAQPSPTAPPNVWGSRSTIYPYGSSFLTRFGNNPAGIQSFGYWLGGQEHYLAVRLRTGLAAGWRYGWVRLQVTNTADPVSLTIKDYALGSSVLAQQPARAAGWQIYPVPTTQLLTVQAAIATTGRLTIGDVCGRVHLSTSFTGTSQQLDLSALAAGLYTLRLETSTGNFTQRIAKQ
ncbi:T9SS type A sorting domain-containing protein [Hymenobacter sp. HMF4947]|uniref:T9SS type A sorting domain-containing protein n=1 Tax=Hymenobacter ginkgonis TaxID=2682976 RepID=A0A7K1THN8_9BACT|nr:T9SS type A sorting domain-containing protein [Hymenobacter ginkgonis]MVN77919.1 T9SS type A sorting domain-containing protein [Hymenobacter ginkgonis]